MPAPSGDLGHLLSRLTHCNPAERPAVVAAHGAVDDVIVALTEEAERLVMDNLQQALEATTALVDVADTAAGPSAQSRARRAHAQALTYANRFDEALTALADAVALAGVAQDEPAAARAKLTMVHALARLGRYDEAVEAGEAARDGFRRHGEEQWAAKAEVNLGVMFRMRNDPEEALRHFDRARQTLAHDPVSLAHVDSNRADALLALNQFDEAAAAFAAARDAFEQAGSTRAAAILEGNLADVLSRQGRLQAALYHFERARRHLETDEAAGDLARIEAEQAEAYAAAGLPAEAAEGYAGALPALDKHGLALEAARTRASLGRALTVLGRLDEAATMLNEGARGYRELDNKAGAGHVALLQGELAMARGEARSAVGLFEAALDGLAERPAEAAVAHRHLGAVALADGDLDETERRIGCAMQAAGVYNLAPLLADLLHLRASLRARQGRGEDALEDLRSAVAEIDRVRGTLQADRLRAAFAGDRTAVYEDLVKQLLASPTDERQAEAFGVCEQARNRALLDLVAGVIEPDSTAPAATADGGSPRLLDEVLRVRADLNALYSRLPEPDPDANAVERWRREVEDRETVLQGLEHRLTATRGVGGLFAAPIDAGQAQALLEPDTVMIEYFFAGDELIAFVLRHDSVQCVTGLADRPDLRELVELARFQIDRALTYSRDEANSVLVKDARSELRELHRVLLAPLADHMEGAKRLVVAPHGLLHGVPFHALYDGRRYTVQDYEVLYSPSASLLSHLPAVPTAPGERGCAIFGVADGVAPHIEQEVHAAAAILPGARVYLGETANWDRLVEEAATADVVHLACHGWFSPRQPLASGVKLGDRWMTVRDVYGLKLDGAVVTLSGCETGRTAVAGGDDQVGLVRGFFAAGASAVLMTLWPIHDETAGILVASIYELWQNEALGTKPTLAEAVRAAQCRLMQENPHPIFWAPFILVGRP